MIIVSTSPKGRCGATTNVALLSSMLSLKTEHNVLVTSFGLRKDLEGAFMTEEEIKDTINKNMCADEILSFIARIRNEKDMEGSLKELLSDKKLSMLISSNKEKDMPKSTINNFKAVVRMFKEKIVFLEIDFKYINDFKDIADVLLIQLPHNITKINDYKRELKSDIEKNFKGDILNVVGDFDRSSKYSENRIRRITGLKIHSVRRNSTIHDLSQDSNILEIAYKISSIGVTQKAILSRLNTRYMNDLDKILSKIKSKIEKLESIEKEKYRHKRRKVKGDVA